MRLSQNFFHIFIFYTFEGGNSLVSIKGINIKLSEGVIKVNVGEMRDWNMYSRAQIFIISYFYDLHFGFYG